MRFQRKTNVLPLQTYQHLPLFCAIYAGVVGGGSYIGVYVAIMRNAKKEAAL